MQHDEAEAFLAHYGKKGMKWGERRAARNQSIKDARSSTEGLQSKYNDLARDLNYKTKYEPNRATTKIAAKKMDDHIKLMSKQQDDFELANKLTSGEKVVAALMVGAVGAYVIKAGKVLNG